MADALLHALPHVERPPLFDELGLTPNGYVLLTLHRPANVDDVTTLRQWLRAVGNAFSDLPIVFPAHPRTVQSFGTTFSLPPNVRWTRPIPYASFLYLQQHAEIIVTDSGGISEEATILRRPCVTLRTSTERPETITAGTNVLAKTPYGVEGAIIVARAKTKSGSPLPQFWDGNASKRIVNILLAL
jgi:UDP-N-acetylglucosamine 2-epimerase (non-hydrolysing)